MNDVVIIGGGFYGVAIACHMRRKGSSVLLLESTQELLTRASYHNQARVHNGYHYPRDLTTAIRSRVNLPRFCRDYPEAVVDTFTKVYAIARSGSKVSARQFVRFCREIGAEIEPAAKSIQRLFASAWVEDVFLVKEYAFDASVLRRLAWDSLRSLGVEVRLGCRAVAVERAGEHVRTVLASGEGCVSREVYHCTYSSLNQLSGEGCRVSTPLKHEITELALVEVPGELKALGLTVMDGPFFSCMPFPARGLHSLSHVRYTPQHAFLDDPGVHPDDVMKGVGGKSRAEQMVRDAARFVPSMAQCRYVDSLFEVKTVLVKNEENDGRPILLERSQQIPGLISVLGGKIDNIYDVIASLEEETLKG